MLKKIASKIKNNQKLWVIYLLALTSLTASYYFVSRGQNLLYGDALSRLNISRKILDNLTPGLAQLGNVWLPLPQILMLPFIWNSYLWHTGIAGTIVSTVAFIAGGMFLYATARLMTKSLASSFFALAIYSLNINLLYYQTTAMSETLFLFTLCASTYFLTKWISTKNRMYIIPAAAFVTAMTLVRYEGLAFLASSILLVYVYTWYRSRDFKTAESNTIMYATLACLGFTIWTLYLTVIFGDPLYWRNYYAGSSVSASKDGVKSFVFNLNVFQAAYKYFTAVVWMNGLIPTAFSLLALPFIVVDVIKNKKYVLLALLTSMSIAAFMVLTLQRNTPIDQPILSFETIMSPATHHFAEFNIRYGLLMLPLISLMAGYLFDRKSLVIKGLLIILFSVQIYSYISPSYAVIYEIPVGISTNITQGTPKEKAMAAWLKNNYDGGLIMISALKHDPQMLQMGFNYKTYIHEGTGNYWKRSRVNPQMYATWVAYDSMNKNDQVTKFLKNSSNLKEYYNKVYEKDGMLIYKIKTKPEKKII